jgi:hypothetical protein
VGSDAEHRQFPRISHPFMARYRLQVPEPTEWMVSPLRDLSSGGARFLSERPLAVGSMLEMRLMLPGSVTPILLKARVAWSKPAQLNMVELGVAFDPGDTAIQQSIDASVAHFLRKQRGTG